MAVAVNGGLEALLASASRGQQALADLEASVQRVADEEYGPLRQYWMLTLKCDLFMDRVRRREQEEGAR